MNHGAKDLWLLKYMKKLMACRDEFIEQNKVRKSPAILFRIGFSKRTVSSPIQMSAEEPKFEQEFLYLLVLFILPVFFHISQDDPNFCCHSLVSSSARVKLEVRVLIKMIILCFSNRPTEQRTLNVRNVDS